MNPFGIVQGRLLRSPPGELQWFPGEDWSKEFHIAKNLGISFIELIAEREYNPNNPLWSEEGRKEIKEFLKKLEGTFIHLVPILLLTTQF